MLEQLRKGNIVLAGDNQVIVRSISTCGIFDTNENFIITESINPVPITIDGLKVIGFAVNGISIMYGHLIYLHKSASRKDSWSFCMVGKGQLHTVKYLHSLQNLVNCMSNTDE